MSNILKTSEIVTKKEPMRKFFSEMELPIEIGDEILVGKFRNRSATVTGFTTDDKGQPIIQTTKGEKKFPFRIKKLLPEGQTVKSYKKIFQENSADKIHYLNKKAKLANILFKTIEYIDSEILKDHSYIEEWDHDSIYENTNKWLTSKKTSDIYNEYRNDIENNYNEWMNDERSDKEFEYEEKRIVSFIIRDISRIIDQAKYKLYDIKNKAYSDKEKFLKTKIPVAIHTIGKKEYLYYIIDNIGFHSLLTSNNSSKYKNLPSETLYDFTPDNYGNDKNIKAKLEKEFKQIVEKEGINFETLMSHIDDVAEKEYNDYMDRSIRRQSKLDDY